MRTGLQTQVKTSPSPSFTPVSRGFLQRTCACGGSAGLDGACEECRKKRLQRRTANGAEPITVPPMVHEVLRSSGQSLDATTRAFMEPRFGYDFSKVRIHTDAKAADSARAVNAIAYTVGREIVFARDRYEPGTFEGRLILAHELSHVVQQGAAPVGADLLLQFGDRQRTQEQEADAAANEVMGEFPHAPIHGSERAPAVMLLTPAQFRQQLSSTPEQKSAIDALFANSTFLSLWNYLRTCIASPRRDLGPLRLEVTPGLTINGVERFGGYSDFTRTLEINPTKPEHISNPAELADTIVHEAIHAVDDLQAACTAAGSGPAPLRGAKTEPFQTHAPVAGTPEETRLMIERGPGASNPCDEFIDINAAAQRMVLQVLTENISVSRVGRPTLTFVNETIRRNPAAMREYEACRNTACALPTEAERRRAITRCSNEIIGRFIPMDLLPALLPTRVYFDFGAHALRADSLETLNLVALFLIAHPQTSVGLIGHADPVGSADANLRLGLRRAEAVRQELLGKGVNPRQIASVTSEGEANPISTGPATHWKDRRVEIMTQSR